MGTQKFYFQKLTPQNDIELGIYDDAIEYAFDNHDICNIAISGAYGAGKSSVIESYKQKHTDKKFLHISLAHFTNNNQHDKSSETKITEADLEGKIINQLIHQIPLDQIPQTNFTIKRKVDSEDILKYTASIFIFILLCFFICLHSTWCSIIEQLSNKDLQDMLYFSTKKEAVLLSGMIIIYMLYKACYEVVKQQMNKKIFRKVNVKTNNFNIELFNNEAASYFDKYLNEVLYLFENVNVDAIVFEDMDRYNTQLIFEKLREINTLLNRKKDLFSERAESPLRFIYLLRDDMFTSKERTKFFDYIIPVVSVIDGSNSFDMLLTYINNSTFPPE